MKRQIKDISPWLDYHIGEAERDLSDYKKYNKLIQENSDRLGLYRKYLIQLHDSYIINTTVTENKFSVTLDEHATGCFAWKIIDKNNLKISPKKLIFPLQIDFETIDISFNKVDFDGGYIEEIEPVDFDEYLYNHILYADEDRMDIGWIVWQNEIKRNERGRYIVILMSVKSITVHEMQDQAWEKLFGNTYDNYYNYFKEQLEVGRYLSESNVCEILYNEFNEQVKDKN